MDSPCRILFRKKICRRLWTLLEVCGSTKFGGRVGEAGAMTLAAEHLGLGLGYDNLGCPQDSSYWSLSQLLNPTWYNDALQVVKNTPASGAEIALNHCGGAALSFICESQHSPVPS